MINVNEIALAALRNTFFAMNGDTELMANQESDFTLPEIMGRKIQEDGQGNVCLNDFWEIAGKPEHLRATEWHRQKRTQALEEALTERIMVKNHNSKKAGEISVYYVVGKGRIA